MCNAYGHFDDCECGFGPPYPVKVEIRKLPDPKDPAPLNAGELALVLFALRANYFDRLDDESQNAICTATAKALQPISDRRFGKAQIEVEVTAVEKGSLEFGFVLLVAGGVVYKFFKDYKDLKEGVITFAGDVRTASKAINGMVRHVYSREERKARRADRKKEKESGGLALRT